MSNSQVVELTKFPDIKQVVHVCAELIVVGVLFFYFQNKFKKLHESAILPLVQKLKENDSRITVLEQNLQTVILELEQMKKVQSSTSKKKVKFASQPARPPRLPKQSVQKQSVVVEEETDDEVEIKNKDRTEPDVEDVEDDTELDREIEAELNERFESNSSNLKKQA